MKSTVAASACALILAGTSSALPTSSLPHSLSARSPLPIDTTSNIDLAEREPLFLGAALKIGLKMGARVYSNWRASKHKRELEVGEDVESRDVGTVVDMIGRSLSDDASVGHGVAASNMGDFDDVLEREFEVATLEDTD